MPEDERAPFRFLAGPTHVALYALQLPLFAFFLPHVVGAVGQHFWLRTIVLVGMLRPAADAAE